MKRLDIQALRGFAVLAVLLFHVNSTTVKGGFLGVDIFFVISGFVITQSLARGTGSFKAQITDFYRRRARRILPVSLVVIVFTAITTRIFLAPLDFKRFGLDAVATTFFAGNIRFAVQGNNYLNQSVSPTPFLHYWSLGVEEQFYLLWPILFLLFFKNQRRLIPFFFAFATVFAIWYTNQAAVNSFYLPISRAWEFLAGIVVALLVKEGKRKSGALIAGIGWITISASILLINTSMPVPGFTTLIPVIATVAILYANHDFFWKKPIAWIGDISFSLYLIHWPLVVIVLQRYGFISKRNQIGLLFISLGFGWLLTRYIENPFRFKKSLQLTLPRWGIAILTSLLIALGCTTIATAAIASGATKINLAQPIIYSNGCHLNFGVDWPKNPCLFGDLKSKEEVILTGDSHAAQYFPALQRIATEKKWKLLSLTKSSCPAVLLTTKRNGIVDSSCARWQKRVIARINEDQPVHVIISNYTESTYSIDGSGKNYATTFAAGQSAFLKALKISSASITYIEDSPHPIRNIPDCLSRNPKGCSFPLTRSATSTSVKSSVKANSSRYLEFESWFCPAGVCSATRNGYNIYRDGSHISVPAVLALIPLISKEF
jgi:peptidoglycan/LPS O-acetylase OafA/YrhL